MSFYVCPRCGFLSHRPWLNECAKCGVLEQWAYPFDDLDEAIAFRTSVRDARRELSRDDAETVGEVCAAYNRLSERVERIEAALSPLLPRGLHSVKVTP